MKSIKEKAEEYATEFVEPFVLYYTKDEVRQFEAQHEDSFEAGANYVLEEIEKELKRRMFEDYNQGEEEDEIAQGCMASMIIFVRQLKK